jgi:outer membrane receptor for ferrienterochelin and colicin
VRGKTGLRGAGLLAGCLWALAAQAQPHDKGLEAYPAAFFADAHPGTATDMLKRVPGFLLDTGSTARGFAASAGNVLVDGARPTAKTDDLGTILDRIPAANVERIEVFRGGAPGIDMQGQTVIANVVRRRQDPGQTILTLENTLIEDGEWVPDGQLEYHDRQGAFSYEASLARTAEQEDDSPGNGYRSLLTPGGVPQYDGAKSYGIMRLGYSAHGSVTAPLWNGEWNNNLTLHTNDYSNGIAYSGNGGSRFDNTQRKREGEFGTHWQGLVGKVNLETLVLERLGDEHDSNTDASTALSEAFLSSNTSGESIGRVTARLALLPELNLEAGGEAAYNYLNGASSFTSNGVATALPNANVTVDERRGEGFVNTTWKMAPRWTLESGVRLEYSNIAESGDTNLSRSFFYAKPRIAIPRSGCAQN